MLQHEFEELIGRKIPSVVYNKIEEEYMENNENKQDFAKNWTPEKIDDLLVATFFKMQMAILTIDGKENAYQQEIKRLQERLHREQESNRAKEHRLWEAYNDIEKLDKEVTDLKAKLYDKQHRRSA